jgi:NAD(P)-dependent dehydrogenase (short-subunit alcohol dehydrogenase family)
MMSSLSGGLDFNDLWKAEKIYFSWKAYSQSKLANILFTQELQRRIDQAGLKWTTVAVHPGAVFTGIIRHFYLGINNYDRLKAGGDVGVLLRTWLFVLKAVTKTSEQGASTQVWLASAAQGDVDKTKGCYVSDYKVRNLWRFAEDKDAAARLWTESEDRAGLRFQF